ncbi:hypothetical protein AKJ52_02700 [candidate division MSBL1 archaeon SCGC-AAA382C18]|uniref:DUF447 domain-containing protein n=1 Tax=candidate division MSBL1 archaeon SCGC-AAA382C18 TaxID=1698281 RepID=A0A133VHT1_9EURY|nr:hypothetical protein AKJ52_02700 [candidate division MSBL1 archaeon SCGC-AAA382C18]
MSLFEKVKLSKNSPSETLLTSFNPKEEPHAAAVGVYGIDREKLKMNLFDDTQTYKNLSKSGEGVVNVVTDPELILKGGLPDIFNRSLGSFDFEMAEEVHAPYISSADAIFEFKIEEMREKTLEDEIGSSKFFETIGLVKNIKILDKNPNPIKRSDFYLVESAVLASKATVAKKKGNTRKFNDIMEEISLFKEKCQKIAPESKASDLISDILGHFGEKIDE